MDSNEIAQVYVETLGILEKEMGLKIPKDKLNLQILTQKEFRAEERRAKVGNKGFLGELLHDIVQNQRQLIGVSSDGHIHIELDEDNDVVYNVNIPVKENKSKADYVRIIAHEIGGHLWHWENSEYGQLRIPVIREKLVLEKELAEQKETLAELCGIESGMYKSFDDELENLIKISVVSMAISGDPNAEIANVTYDKINELSKKIEKIYNSRNFIDDKELQEGWAVTVGNIAEQIYKTIHNSSGVSKKRQKNVYDSLMDIAFEEQRKHELNDYNNGAAAFAKLPDWETQKAVAMQAESISDVKSAARLQGLKKAIGIWPYQKNKAS